jgi:uncharacterized membrane protein YgcG
VKRIFILLLIAALVLLPVSAAFADGETELSGVPEYIAKTDGGKPTLVDECGLLTESEAAALSQRLREIGTAYQCDVIIVTVPDLGSKTVEECADEFFVYNGYGYGATPDANGMTVNGDGVMLLLSMADRDYCIYASGYGSTAFTDYGKNDLAEKFFLPYLKNNDYAQGFNAFARGCETMLDMARSGMPYDVTHVVTDPLYMDQTDLRKANDRSESYEPDYGIAVYFFRTANAADLNAFMIRFVNERVRESNAIVFGANDHEHLLFVRGSDAKEKFSDEDLKAIEEAVVPYLDAGDTNGAVTTYLDQCEKVLTRHPINIFALIASLFGGGALAFGPVGRMKRQMTSVSKQTSADNYLAPQSFALKQNSDVLLGTHVSRSVHVVQTSSGDNRRGGSGGGFHGGTTTHTSVSGGSYSSHSGKF